MQWVGSPSRVDKPEGGKELQEGFGTFALAFYTIEMMLRMLGCVLV
jgi:hypothetical protein